MKNIAVCIGNGLLSEAIIKMLKNSGARFPLTSKTNGSHQFVFLFD